MSPSLEPSSSLLIVFLKAPRPGHVKTRLAAAMGEVAACEVYQELVARVLGRIRSFPSVELRITPDDGLGECQQWAQSGWAVKAQGTGGLGERLSLAFAESFSVGWKRVMAIGSDCPEVGLEQIESAVAALEEDPIALGPALDGGYWLIGMNQYFPELFRGIDWSTEVVFEQTCRAVRRLDQSVSILERLEDIDELDAWNRYQNKKK